MFSQRASSFGNRSLNNDKAPGSQCVAHFLKVASYFCIQYMFSFFPCRDSTILNINKIVEFTGYSLHVLHYNLHVLSNVTLSIP